MAKSFTYERQTQMADTDAAGIVHFARLLCFVEEAEHAWLRELEYEIRPGSSDALQWPRVACSAEYLYPVLPMQRIAVDLTVAEIGKRSLTWDWTISGPTDVCARGTMKIVCALREPTGITSRDLPDLLRNRLSDS
ncbi:MAG: acyl-CoA thioesterase [Verrucomicrobia bacterium]|nr:acyl-CoA thioesterase [Verrucomicrobiota bacterium]MCH8510737.1 acyl-CoA thioesterase [Kiritimatiellia bacterium]